MRFYHKKTEKIVFSSIPASLPHYQPKVFLAIKQPFGPIKFICFIANFLMVVRKKKTFLQWNIFHTQGKICTPGKESTQLNSAFKTIATRSTQLNSICIHCCNQILYQQLNLLPILDTTLAIQLLDFRRISQLVPTWQLSCNLPFKVTLARLLTAKQKVPKNLT